MGCGMRVRLDKGEAVTNSVVQLCTRGFRLIVSDQPQNQVLPLGFMFVLRQLKRPFDYQGWRECLVIGTAKLDI